MQTEKHNCFISFKKEDEYYKNEILVKLGNERILGKALDKWIDSDDIEYVMQVIRKEYMQNTSVTLFLIGKHSSENEGIDAKGDKNAFIKRELQATLFDGKEFRRSGLLGIVLPEMEKEIYRGTYQCDKCKKTHSLIAITDDTVVKEFSANYYLVKDLGCSYSDKGRFCVLVRYSDFINNPDDFINMAHKKLSEPICKEVHWRDLR